MDGKYRRMPESVAKTVSEGLWGLSEHTAGGRVRFVTDSPYVVLKTRGQWGKMCHFALTGSAGYDMYAECDGDTRYVDTFCPPFDVTDGFETVVDFADRKERVITINFPLYSCVEELYLGLQEGCVLKEAPSMYITRDFVRFIEGGEKMQRREILKNFKEQEEVTRERVERGIETYRKGDFCIQLLDNSGMPLKGVTVEAELKNHAFRHGANIFMLDEFENEEKNAKYKEYFVNAFNMATLPFYWETLEPEKGKTRYTKDSPKIYRRPAPDLCLEFCEKHNIEPREHALAYDHFFPDWARKLPTEQLKKELTRRFEEISKRYADRIRTIEVTNETMWELAEGNSAFFKEDDFVEWCYWTAGKYFPENQLVINEDSNIWKELATNRDPYYMTIERALRNGARIDAIGMQFHILGQTREEEVFRSASMYNPSKIYQILDKYSDFKKPIQITEITIPAYSEYVEDEEIQAEIIRQLYEIWFSHPLVEKIIYWNLVDGYAAGAAPGDMTKGQNVLRAGLLRYDLSPKPAYDVVCDLFKKQWHTKVTLKTDGEGKAYFRGFFGDYTVKVQDRTECMINGEVL